MLFKIITIIHITTADWGKLYKLIYVLLNTSILFLGNHRVNANSYTGWSRHCHSGHPHIINVLSNLLAILEFIAIL